MASQKKPFPAFPQQSNPSQRLVWEADVRDAQQQEEDGKFMNPITPHQAHECSHLTVFTLLLLSQFAWPQCHAWERGWKAI